MSYNVSQSDIDLTMKAYTHEELARKYCLLQNDVMEAEKQIKAAEIEALKDELETWKQDRFNIFQSTECYVRAQKKVAREIFEELGSVLFVDGFGGGRRNLIIMTARDFEAIKNKYTEEQP